MRSPMQLVQNTRCPLLRLGHRPSALPVVAERIAVPTEAGRVDPLDWLPAEKACIVDDLPGQRLPEHLWDPVVRACHHVPAEQEAGLARRLLESSMAVLVEESLLPRNQAGELLTGGLFSVPKNEVEDRLIFDRRPENSTMNKLRWTSLPNGACYTRMLLEPHQYLRGSGDDLRNYYYTLKLPDNWVKYNSVGRQVDASVVRDFGGDPACRYRLCFRVLGMGDVNGCDIAQATHEALLQRFGLLGPETHLVYGKPAPVGSMWQGVYLDDLLITSIRSVGFEVPLDGSFEPPAAQDGDEDIEAVRKAEHAYDEAHLERALHKSFRAVTLFKAWGSEIDGIRGKAGAPLLARQQVYMLIVAVVRAGRATRGILEKINGFVAFFCQYRREIFCLQHHIYNYVSGLPLDTWVRLPGFILDELRSVSLHLPFCVWHMRRSFVSSLLATDATPSSGGAVRAPVPGPLLRELWRRSEVRGETVRLDRSIEADFLEAEPREPSRFASRLSESLDWKTVAGYTFRQVSHINLQETRALGREVRRLASGFSNGGSIQICLNDSRVAVGAVSKGRSSSYKLNGLLRALLPYLIFGDIALALLWVETESNLADHPSRFRPLPPPRRLARWMLEWGLRPRREPRGLEVFAGDARLTQALREVGVRMLEPTFLFEAGIDLAIASGEITWLWITPPCNSFSPLRDLDCGGPLRPKGDPAGDATNPEVQRGNHSWCRALELAAMIFKAGGYFIIEHPRRSKAWALRVTEVFEARGVSVFHKVDWCAYADPHDPEPPSRKPTTLLSNAPWLHAVVRRCPGSHQHAVSLRGARAKSASSHPWGFCREVADAITRWEAAH